LRQDSTSTKIRSGCHPAQQQQFRTQHFYEDRGKSETMLARDKDKVCDPAKRQKRDRGQVQRLSTGAAREANPARSVSVEAPAASTKLKLTATHIAPQST
jgi:hypothetical protein